MLRRFAQSEDFGVSRWIASGNRLVEAATNDVAAANDNRANRNLAGHFGFLRLEEC
jgi:hypothetical protein